MIYEIVNPSDDYSLEADSFEVACVACLIVGTGHYGLRAHTESIDGHMPEHMPVFLLGGAEDWFRSQFGVSIDESFARADRAALADCLDSVLIGNRRDFSAGLAECATEERRAAFREAWHERHRSSLNDIGGRARRIAERFRRPKEVTDGNPTAATS